jgi:ferredoxin-NADP reductase
MTPDWHIATLQSSHLVSKNVKALRFSVPSFPPYIPGQHVDIRLTAEDGYQAERSYSIASAPEEPGTLELGIELLPDGEVSPYLWSLVGGDQIEIRGPIGGHFIWDTTMPGPLALLGGGSGMVPLMSMLRHRMYHLDTERDRKIVALFSVRSLDHLLYYDELRTISQKDPNFTLVLTFTETVPPGWDGYRRRIDAAMLRDVFGNLSMPLCFLCGPTKFVEVGAMELVEIGINPHEIRTERFG